MLLMKSDAPDGRESPAKGLFSNDDDPCLPGPSLFELVPRTRLEPEFGVAHPCVASTVSTARYLLAIFEVDRDEPRLTAAAVARRLEVSTPSAHEMMSRLETMGLIERHPLRLTADGMSTALVLNTRRRAARRLAEEVLGMDAEAADEEAHHLAATLSPTLGRRLTDWYGRQAQPVRPDAGPDGAGVAGSDAAES
jgi:Mn-dependent DtxR family transcriptional regulator